MISIRSLRFVFSDNLCFLGKHKQKEVQAIRNNCARKEFLHFYLGIKVQELGIIWELQTIKPAYYPSQTRHSRSLKVHEQLTLL